MVRVPQSTLTDVDLSLHDDQGAGGDFAGGDDALARRVSRALTEPRQSLNISRLQDREHLIVSGFDQRGHILRHDFPSYSNPMGRGELTRRR